MTENNIKEIQEELEQITPSSDNSELETAQENTIVENEQEEDTPNRETVRDELFENLKNGLLQEDRLLKKFFSYSDEHCEFEYEEMGLDFDEADEVLRRANILKDKLLDNIEQSLEISCTDRKIDTLHNIIIFNSSYQENSYKIIIEVFEDSFDLEIV